MNPTFSDAEFSSSSYRWRLEEGKILATIFSQTRNSISPKVKVEDDANGNMDVDAKVLRDLFEEKSLFPVPAQVVYKYDLSFEEVRDYLKSIDDEMYDCFFFCFLTYSQPETPGANFHDERLHFKKQKTSANDTSFETDKVSFSEVLDEVKGIDVATGKPKVFLIQADDVSFLEPEQVLKGPTFKPDVKEMKIPQDADRIIIKSTIPQRIARWDPEGKIYTNKKTPSLFVQAFEETVRENATRAKQKADFLTMTISVNEKVKCMIDKSKHTRADDLLVPLTTSTFTKLLSL